jgi:hypothetical protein
MKEKAFSKWKRMDRMEQGGMLLDEEKGIVQVGGKN